MTTIESWPTAPNDLCLSTSAIDVWRFPLHAPAETITELIGFLCVSERERAHRLRIPAKRNEFITSRAVMRTTLARLLDLSPIDLPIIYNPHGKPKLDPRKCSTPVGFNLTHSGDWGLLAVALNRHIGIDVQWIDPHTECEKLAERFFSSAEGAAILALPLQERRGAFFRCWTRKEALLKAMGRGIAMGLHTFDVTVAPGDPPAVLATRFDPAQRDHWRLSDIDIENGYAAALAADGEPFKTRRWDIAIHQLKSTQ